MGQHPRHWQLCVFLVTFLRRLCGREHAVSADMFLYWNAADERHCRAPDAAVKLGLPIDTLEKHGAWKTWELGVPELVVEILSLSDSPERWTFEEKLEAYQQLGVREFVCFDLDAPEGTRLRIWDRIDDDFVERVVERDAPTPCVVLSQALGTDIAWTVAPTDLYPVTLRLLDGGLLVPTEKEERDAERARADAAEARARDLEAKLEQLTREPRE